MVNGCNIREFAIFLSTQEFTFSEAFFESMSGITTTGATIISDLDNSPKSILLWRAIMQWLVELE